MQRQAGRRPTAHKTQSRAPRAPGQRLIAGVLTCLIILGAGGSARGARAAVPAKHARGTGLAGFHLVGTTVGRDGARPVVFFMGALYCPFCATERWALVRATSRFGRWSGLRPLQSTAGVGGFGSLATYDVRQATYRSSLIALQTREVADARGQALQPLTARQTSLVNAYDPRGSIPMTLIGGRYAQLGSGYSPALLLGLSFSQIEAHITHQPTSTLARAISAEANVLTALICATLPPAPRSTSACQTPAVRALLSQL